MSRAAPTPSPPAARSITDYTISYVAGTLTVTPAPLTITADNQTKVYGAALPTLDRQLLRLRQRRHVGQPDHPAHADDHRHRQQPRRRQPLRHHRQRRGRSDYTISYVAGQPDRHPGAADDHGRQPDQGLRRRAADADGQLHRLRQRRHVGQPDHPAHADHDGHRQQPCRGQPLRHHRQRRGRSRLHDHATSPATLTVTPAPLTITADNQTKVYGAALPTLTASYIGLRQRRHLGQPDHPAHAHDDGHRQQPCGGQPLRHHRQRRGGLRLHDQLRRRQL